MKETGAEVIVWTGGFRWIRAGMRLIRAVQGNLDPVLLFAGWPE